MVILANIVLAAVAVVFIVGLVDMYSQQAAKRAAEKDKKKHKHKVVNSV